ncbi:hypothetical protein ACPPVU_02660 [Mucilaginibacter sp. McL0603]|uniref:hypothetical protein n=1 Tax=Mucilaginibacter sp. McL0603 TaxID=3415670 RepID=UPI003CED6367
MDNLRHLSAFPIIKTSHALMLFDHFITELQKIGPVNIHPHKTMISIANTHKGVAYVTQAGKAFIHIVFPFKRRYDDNLCFNRIQEVPGRNTVYHHFRMLYKEDVNDEIREFMRIAYQGC